MTVLIPTDKDALTLDRSVDDAFARREHERDFVLYVLAPGHVYLAGLRCSRGFAMRPRRLVQVIAAIAAILLSAIVPSVVAAASTAIPIHLVKDCSTFTAEIPSFCTISGSDMAAIPVGAKVAYLGPLLDNVYFLSSNVEIEVSDGSTTTGYCMFDGRATEQRGLCTFWSGTGTLNGFTAILDVTIDATGLWHLDGVYYGDPAPVGRDPQRPVGPRPS